MDTDDPDQDWDLAGKPSLPRIHGQPGQVNADEARIVPKTIYHKGHPFDS
jgi:hypothetical protein